MPTAALLLASLSLGAFSAARLPDRPPVLRVCSDPNNLPFSNLRREGFENRIAAVLAEELGARVEYTWWPERRGFIRKTLGAGRCDVVMGIPVESDRVLVTRPYYMSTYVFLSRRDRAADVRSLDDSTLRRLRIGVHFIGDDYTNTPPAHALARRGIVRTVVGYSIYGDYSRPNPPAELVHAVARGDVDLAIVWGPFAGYFGPRESVPLRLRAVLPSSDPPGLRFTFAIAVGVVRGDTLLRDRLDAALVTQRLEIQEILHQYGVPLVNAPGTPTAASRGCAARGKEATCG